MSARTSRRSHAGAYGALPGTPISEIRTRKWSKQLKAVGHLSIPKWVPDQENPTEALQKGSSKKSKGRKRGAGDVGRMTRSVRQHLDAPLELLSEYPVRVHSSRQSSPARGTTGSTPLARTLVPMPLSDTAAPVDGAVALAQGHPQSVPTPVQEQVKHENVVTATVMQTHIIQPVPDAALKTEAAPMASAFTVPTSSILPMMPPVSNQMMAEVPSDEQLELALDDLPMLTAEDSFSLDALDPVSLPTPAPTGVPPASMRHSSGTNSKQQSAENLSALVSEDEASANSGSSMPSASPQSSPGMMSRSPSP